MSYHRRHFLKLSAGLAAASVAAPFVARAAKRKLRIAHSNSTLSTSQEGCLSFQKYMLEKSEGRFEVEIFPSGQLGNDAQLAKMVSEGTLDAAISPNGALGAFDPDVPLAEFPYLFRDIATARKAMDGSLGAHFTEVLKKSSVAVLAWGENGIRHVTANKPVRNVADLKGLKIRVQPSKVQIEAFLGLGATAEALAFTELGEALRTGRVEAQENPVSNIAANEFIYKHQSHISLTGHVYSPFASIFSSDVLEELSEADRAMVQGAGAAAAKTTRDFNEKADVTGLDKLKAAGMTVVTDVDRASFQKAMVDLNDRLAVLVGADSMARVRGLVA
jgi:tripartite ATP-independent transporter DctP family solute receptor